MQTGVQGFDRFLGRLDNELFLESAECLAQHIETIIDMSDKRLFF